jgi:hypothetical protein
MVCGLPIEQNIVMVEVAECRKMDIRGGKRTGLKTCADRFAARFTQLD